MTSLFRSAQSILQVLQWKLRLTIGVTTFERHTTMRTLLLALVFSSMLLSGPQALADVSEATFTPQGNARFAQIPEDKVEVYVFKPDFKFRIIGLIEARGMAEANSSIFGLVDDAVDQLLGNRKAQPGEREDIALAMKALRQEAAANGAYGVVVVRSIQVQVSQNATERRIVAAAIRPE